MQKRHIDQRIELAKKYLDPKNRIKNLIFSDEKKFLMNNNDKDEFVTRKKGSDPYQDSFMNYGKQVSSRADLNVWSYIGPFGKGELFCAENIKCYYSDGKKKPNVTSLDINTHRGFDGPSYLHLMKYRAIPLIKSKLDNNIVIIQDNASIHKANKNSDIYSVFDLYKEEGIEVEDWPARSPDLSPIENCWSLLDKKKNKEIDNLLKLNLPLPKNKSEMFILLKKCWNSIDNETVIKMHSSFYSRLSLAIQNEGKNNFDYKSKY